MNALMDHIWADSPNITFYLHELLPPKVRNLANHLMIIFHVNGVGIRRTLVDIGSKLNVCRLDFLPKIKVDPKSLAASSLYIRGFDNYGKTVVGTVILSLKFGPITIPTLVHVMPSPLSYNLLLGRPCLHALGVISSTLHGVVKFVADNQVVTVRADPKAMQLCQIATVDQAAATPSFHNWVPSLSSLVITFGSGTSSTLR